MFCTPEDHRAHEEVVRGEFQRSVLDGLSKIMHRLDALEDAARKRSISDTDL